MPTLFRLHTASCKKGYARRDRTGDKCDCVIHVEGKLGSEFLRRSTGTRSMTRARKMLVEAEERGSWEAPELAPVICIDSRKTIAAAVAEFQAECADVKGKNLGPASLSKYRTILGRLKSYCDDRGVVAIADVRYEHLAGFKGTWKTNSTATANNIARLRAFWAYAVKMEWCSVNVAKKLDMPRNDSVEREPFSEQEMTAILHAARTINFNRQQPVTNEELEAFILVMRYSGMAISDAALLESSELVGDEVRYYRNKTRRHSRKHLAVIPLPPFVLAKLKALPLQNGRYYFCHGSPLITTIVKLWHRRLEQVFTKAAIENGTSHRFRHTFATDLLTRGVSIELVSRWLGHANTSITARFYSHWIENRIQAASDELRKLYK